MKIKSEETYDGKAFLIASAERYIQSPKVENLQDELQQKFGKEFYSRSSPVIENLLDTIASRNKVKMLKKENRILIKNMYVYLAVAAFWSMMLNKLVDGDAWPKYVFLLLLILAIPAGIWRWKRRNPSILAEQGVMERYTDQLKESVMRLPAYPLMNICTLIEVVDASRDVRQYLKRRHDRWRVSPVNMDLFVDFQIIQELNKLATEMGYDSPVYPSRAYVHSKAESILSKCQGGVYATPYSRYRVNMEEREERMRAFRAAILDALSREED